MTNFKSLLGIISKTWAMLYTSKYRLFENLRAHFAWRVKQALIFTIHTFSNNLVFFDIFQSQPWTFYIISNFDSGCSWLKIMEHNLRSTILEHPVYAEGVFSFNIYFLVRNSFDWFLKCVKIFHMRKQRIIDNRVFFEFLFHSRHLFWIVLWKLIFDLLVIRLLSFLKYVHLILLAFQ